MEPVTQHQIPQILITPQLPQNRPDAMMKSREGLGTNEAGELKAPVLSAKKETETSKAASGEVGFWGSDGFTFGDLLDFVNPLQHIPVVSTIYRAITGDEIGVGPRMFGGALMGGIAGVGVALANAAVEHETGKDIGENVLAVAQGAGSKAMAMAGFGGGEAQVLTAAAASSGLSPLPEVAAYQAPSVNPVAFRLPQDLADEIKPDPIKVLGGAEMIHQQYREAQFLDLLQEAALDMDA